MKTIFLIASATAIGLTAGASQAASHHHAGMASAGAYAEPAQPIAYTQLSAYLKASPRAKKTGDWGGQMAASTGTNVNAAATTAPPAADTTQPNAASPATAGPNAAPAPTPVAAPPDANASPSQQPMSPAAPANPAAPTSNAPATQPQ
ncbi:MAG TPA: hypothetical protein VN805_13600 [Caulobacteraceae bacterium]|nr:hypothetical protein [Caulobacteraceae bacterium]